MDFEEKKQEEMSTGQTTGSRDGYQPASTSGSFQREYKPGRSPRPRIRTGQRPFTNDRPSYNRQNNDEGGFRPEGFGAGLQSQAPQRSFRPRRPNYGRPQDGENNYNSGYGQQRSYQKPYKPYNNDGDEQQGGYQPRQQGGYQPRQGGYQPRHNPVSRAATRLVKVAIRKVTSLTVMLHTTRTRPTKNPIRSARPTMTPMLSTA